MASDAGLSGDAAVRFYEFDRFRVDAKRRLLTRDGQPVAIKPKALETLLVLLQHPGQLLDKEELMNRLWPGVAVEEANLTQNIFVIRKALGEAPGEQRYIATVARQGYRFVADVRQAVDEAASVRADASDTVTAPAGGVRRRWVVAAAYGALLLAVVGAVAAALLLRRWAAGPQGVLQSIAILPFRNASGDPQDDYFADGVTDAITTDLASISSLRVISRQSAATFRASSLPLPEIARRLDVDTLVLGSVARSGGRIRINVQLVDGSSDRHLWAESYDRDLGDVLALQGQLARAVATAIRARLTETEVAELSDRRPVVPEAYSAYLRAKHFVNMRSEDALRKGVELYKQATAMDSTFAAAYGELAVAYALLLPTMPVAENRRLVSEAASAALRLEPRQADAAVALAASSPDRSFELTEAVARAHPNHLLVQGWYGSALIERCRQAEGLAQRRLAVRLDPLSTISHLSLGLELARRGQHDEALASLNTALELDPQYADAHGIVGWTYLRMGRRAEAIQAFETCARLSSHSPRMMARLAHAYGLVGRSDDARRLLRQMEERSRATVVPPLYFAHVYAGLGDFDRAFEKLNEAVAAGGMVRINSDPLLVPLFGDQRFAELGRRLNRPAPCPADAPASPPRE